MTSDSQAKRTIKKSYSEQPLFEMSDYVESPALMKKLHETTLTDVKGLKEQLATATSSNQTMQLHNKELEVNLNTAIAEIKILTQDKADALVEARVLREQLETVKSANQTKELEKQRLELSLEEARGRLRRNNWRSLLQLVTTISGTAIFSIGVNLATSKENVFLGWGMIVIGAIVEIAAFLFGFSPR